MRALIGLMVVAPIVSSCLAIHVHDRPLAELEAERIATPYTKLPAGSIEPRGWLRKQLELQAAGFHGRLTEISPFLRRDGNAWLAKDGQGERGWEEVPYWLKGYIGCAFALNDPKMIAEARVWIDGAIASQDASGMFGPRGKGAASTVQSTSGPLDLWSNMVMLNCLQTWHEATGDARVLELMRKYFAFELTIPDDQFLPPYWQQQRAADNLASVLWLYERAPDPQLLELAKKIHRHTANWTDGIPDWHNVNMAQAFGGPATYWRVSRDRKHLDAAERNFRTIRETYGQVPGGMFGGDENCRPGFADPRQAIETCGMVEMMLSCERLFAITGDAVWAERCEDVAYNSLPAAFMPDYSGLRYLTSPNMVQSDASPKAPGLQNGGNMLEMRCDDHRCCQHNAGHGWPYFSEHAWMATQDGGLALVFPVASRVKTKVQGDHDVAIDVESHYPFGGTIRLRMSTDGEVEFPLTIRVPHGCTPLSVVHEGDALELDVRSSLMRFERTFENGDVVEVRFAMTPSIRTWAGNHDSVSVDVGPLTYALRIGEHYRKSSDHPLFPGHEIYAKSPWNYGLELDPANPTQSFTLQSRPWPIDDQPFTQEGTPLMLIARGRRIPQWRMDGLGLVGLLQQSPAFTEEPLEELTLIPMGAARLRISAFPTVRTSANAHAWTLPPASTLAIVRASHCNETDTTSAVADGVLPSSSSDTSIPRFTWWDHVGTSEWIERELSYGKVASTRVFWFDDEAIGGRCRLPANVSVRYRWNGQWKPVDGLRAGTPARDGWHGFEFTPVDTDALRLEVRLQDGVSAGILEWEIPEASQ
jgi:hypothetical protein